MNTQKMLTAVVVSATLVALASCACPPDVSGLTSFASLFPALQKTDTVMINQAVLLDVPLVDVTMIKIMGSGRLEFGRGISITVRARSIMVMEQGALVIGSEACRHDDPVNIILEGERSEDQSQVGHEGEKVIAVMDDGQLHIHGTDKLSWTKLTTTVNHLASYYTDPTKVKYIHSTSANFGYRDKREGLALYVLDTGANVVKFDAYDIYNPLKPLKEQTEIDRLVADLNAVADGNLVALPVQNRYEMSNPDTDPSQLYTTIETMAGIPTGELMLRDLHPYDAYALVFVKGSSDYKQTVDQLISKVTTFTLTGLAYADYKISATSYMDPASREKSHIEFRVLDPAIGFPVINVLEDISAWSKDDEIIITSTDYEPSHTESRKIKEILTATSFSLQDELMFRHFGEIEDRVDMRAEVALLSRNIKIEGEMSRDCPSTNKNCLLIPFDSFGGHIKIMHSFGSAHIQGAEFIHMGQATQKGTYPIHFHMLQNITGQSAIVQGNSIHHTLQRCITVHGTYGTSVENPGVILEDNVAFDVYGHCYFLEDGAEIGTIMRRNLAAHVKHINNGFFTTDNEGVSGFWITNPKVEMISNVAAGSEGFGIWVAFPVEPVGPSAGLGVYQPGEAIRTPMWTFDNNVCHSNVMGGLQYENIVQDDSGNIDDHLKYDPRVDPLDKNSATVKVQGTRLTAYKNKERNVWLSGGFEIMAISSAESQIGVLLSRGNPDFQPTVKNGIFIGLSRGNSEDASYPDAYDPAKQVFQVGIGFLYGPQYCFDSWFTGYQSAADHTFVSGALGFKPVTQFATSIVNAVYGMRFGFADSSEGNRVFSGNTAEYGVLNEFEHKDGNELYTFRDLDGSVSACTPADYTGPQQVVRPEKFQLTPNCVCRTNTQMCYCDESYGTIIFSVKSVWSGSVGSFDQTMHFKRLHYTDASDVAYEDHDANVITPQAHIVLGDESYYYQIQLNNSFPQAVEITTEGVESAKEGTASDEVTLKVKVENNKIFVTLVKKYRNGKDFVMGLCLPEGTTSDELTLKVKVENTKIVDGDFVWGTSLQDVRDDDSMGTVFLDGRFLYMHFAATVVRDPYNDLKKCLVGYCPLFIVTVASERPYTPCFTATEEELSTDNMLATATLEDCEQAASDPEPNWGAGDTMASHDGHWGYWSPWSTCSGGARERSRSCDSPTPFGDGQPCSATGEYTETESGNC